MQKNIIICCDGTGNEPGKNDTNVVRIFALAQKDTPEQICFYDPGVGCGNWEYDNDKAEKMADQATGDGLQKNVNDAYEFLMQTYNSGDRVFLFGFSRGAFTARSLAGMLYKVGLLRPHLKNMLGYAAKMYNTEGNPEAAAHFKQTFAQTCFVQFIGVWDTVESLTFKAGERHHEVGQTPETHAIYHALAADECRRQFKPALISLHKPSCGIVSQKWFAGCHADIGGGYENRELSDIPLRWIADMASLHGMKFDEAARRKIKGNPRGMLHDEYNGAWKLAGKHQRKATRTDIYDHSLNERIAEMPGGYTPMAELKRQ